MNSSDLTVAVVCRNEEHHIKLCIHSILSQKLLPKEILVIDNGSTDNTGNILKKLQHQYKRITIIHEKSPSISKCRNIAVRRTSTSLIAFIDADCVAPKHWLDRLYSRYVYWKNHDRNIVAVGGSNVPPDDTFFHKALALLLDSFLGTGSSVQGRIYQKEHYIPHLPCVNVLYENAALKHVRGFDETLGSIIEDEDISYRLRRNGRTYMYIPSASVIHDLSSNIFDWMKKMFRYGKGRAWFITKFPETISPKSVFPILLLSSFGISVFYRPIIVIPLLYLILVILTSFGIIFAKRISYIYIIALPILFISTHISYGFGVFYGLIIKRKPNMVLSTHIPA